MINQDLIIIGLILIGTLVSIFIPLYLRKTKKLSYEIVLNTSLIDVNSKVKDKIMVHYKGNTVDNPQLSIIRFINNGNQPINTSDFEDKIKLIFPEQTKIIQCDSSNSANLDLSYTIENNTIIIKPLLINSKENFTFNLIIDGQDSNFRIIDRIKGVNIKKYSEPFLITHDWISIVVVYLILIAYLLYFSKASERTYSAEETLAKFGSGFELILPFTFFLLIIILIPHIFRYLRNRSLKDQV